MDGIPQQQTPAEPKKNALFKEFEFGVGGVMLGVGTFLLMLFVLNYFNLVSLSLVFPNYFGFLPHRAVRGSTPQGFQPLVQTSLLSPTPVKIILSCPVPKEFCSKAKIIKEGAFNGLGFNLPQGTALLTVFEGTLSDITPQVKERSPNHPLLALKDKEENEANYSFYGSSSASLISQTATKGTEIGIIGEGTFPPYPPLSGLNFLFTLKREGKTIEIDPGQFVE